MLTDEVLSRGSFGALFWVLGGGGRPERLFLLDLLLQLVDLTFHLRDLLILILNHVNSVLVALRWQSPEKATSSNLVELN